MQTLKNLEKLENVVIAVCFIVMSLAAFAQVVNRNLIGASISWFDELARYCMVYMTLLATEAGLRDGSQIAITSITDKMPPKVRRAIQLIVKVVIIGFSALIFKCSLTLLSKQLMSGQISAGLGIPMWLPYFSLTLAFGLIAVVQLGALYLLAKSPLVKPEDNNKENA